VDLIQRQVMRLKCGTTRTVEKWKPPTRLTDINFVEDMGLKQKLTAYEAIVSENYS
jgi:hypothetical protein